ncbi:MAG: site-specific integrase, partial [Desulfobacterales bacterium]
WITYRLSGGKQRTEYVGAMEGLDGFSINDARDAQSKRRVQKRENRILDIKPDSKMTFRELSDWYLDLEKVKALASYEIIKINLRKFNKVFGNTIIAEIRPADLENYQAKRKTQGKADGTVDHEIGKAKTMINKAFDNDIVSGSTLKAFKRVKKTLKPGSDVRDRILTHDEFKALVKHSKDHIKPIIITGYYTGMRRGEIFNLIWDKVDLANRMIRLEAEDTKDREKRNIPICDELYQVLKSLPNRIQKARTSNYVFLYKSDRIKGDIRDSLKDACEKAGIIYGRFKKDGFIFHDLRHTFNTNMRKAGVAESVIMEITGHSSRSMFDRYNTIDEDDTRNAIDQLESHLSNVYQIVYQKQDNKNKCNNDTV